MIRRNFIKGVSAIERRKYRCKSNGFVDSRAINGSGIVGIDAHANCKSGLKSLSENKLMELMPFESAPGRLEDTQKVTLSRSPRQKTGQVRELIQERLFLLIRRCIKV